MVRYHGVFALGPSWKRTAWQMTGLPAVRGGVGGAPSPGGPPTLVLSLALTLAAAPSGGPDTAGPVVSQAAAATADAAPEVVLVADEAAAPAEEEGGFGYYFPFSLDDNLHPAVEDNLVALWIGYALGGFLWPGYTFTDELAGVDYIYEAALSSFLHSIILIIPLPGRMRS